MQSQVQPPCPHKEEGGPSANPSLSLCPSLAELEGGSVAQQSSAAWSPKMSPRLCRFHPPGAGCPQAGGWGLCAVPKDQGEAGRRLTQVLIRPKLLPRA